jgi:tRNA 2-selenouridine synthase
MTGLVCDYYDKVYYKNRDWEGDFNLCLEDFDRAAHELTGFLNERLGGSSRAA